MHEKKIKDIGKQKKNSAAQLFFFIIKCGATFFAPHFLIEITDIRNVMFTLWEKVFVQLDKIIVRHTCKVVYDNLIVFRLLVRRFPFARIIGLV